MLPSALVYIFRYLALLPYRLDLASMSNLIRKSVVCCFLIATVMVLQGGLLPSGFFVACQSTNFSFPEFSVGTNPSFIFQGDITSQNSSMYLNKNSYDYSISKGPINYSCGKFLYPDSVKMKDFSTSQAPSQVSSFSTSFTFEIILNRSIDSLGRYINADGFAFTLVTDSSSLMPFGDYQAAEILCVNKSISTTQVFAVEVDTWLNFDDYDPSDSHIAVDLNNVIHSNSSSVSSTHIYNLCKPPQNTSYCGYFANNAGPFTVWIDYDAPTQMVDVRFSPGPGEPKPAATIIHTKVDLSPVLNEFMYAGFSGSYALYREAHRILSWNFSSGFAKTASPQPAPAPSPQPGSPASESKHVGLIAGIISGSLGACATIILFGILLWYRNYRSRTKESTFMLPLMGPRMFTFRELSKATKDFNESELLGKGGFGAVYKGTLQPSGAVVAVKRWLIKLDNRSHAEESFVAEATSISQIRHRNLVALEGWCKERGELFLVYDYMPKGSLDEWLFNHDEVTMITWDVRYDILAGVAAALAYLHEEWKQCVLHRDIKSSNVMLDAEFNAHLGDFGLARLTDHQRAEKTTATAGTLGYMAPEMFNTPRASKETDVYSFGVLILEVVCGKKPLDPARNPGDISLVECVWRAHEAGDLLSMADSRLGTRDQIARLSASVSINAMEGSDQRIQPKPNSVKDVLQLGLLCCQLNPSQRPSMRLVKHMFQTGDGAALPPLPASRPRPFGIGDFDIMSSVTSSSNTGSY